MNEQQMKHFIDLLGTSGLGEDRIDYWVEKISGGQFTEKDESLLTQELEEHLVRVDIAIGVAKLEVEAREEEFLQKKQEALPYLESLHTEQVKVQKQQEERYKKEISDSEKETLAQIEELRGEKDSNAIEALRKRLGKG